MAEVAELYEANITLHYENTLLKKKLEKYGKGEILGAEKADSMNMETEEDGGDNLYEFGSYTDNDELGNSHYDESLGSIHNIFVDPNSESYKKEKAREKKLMVKPEIIPKLEFDKLYVPVQKPNLKLKVNSKKKNTASNIVNGYSLSNRTEEWIDFATENENQNSETLEGDQNSIHLHIEETKNFGKSKTQDKESNHILIKEVNDISSHLCDDSRHVESNFSKVQNSCFANSSNTTKKKIYLK